MLRAWKQFLFETPEATPAAVEPPPAAVVPDAPWAADAATYGLDPAAFDRYMREKQQPYVTQLEESSADARAYYKDLQDNTDETLRALIEQRYGDEFATEFDGLFGTPAPEADPTPAPAADEIPEWAKPLVESHQQRVDRELKQEQEAAYQDFKNGLKASHGLDDEDLGLIDPFIYGSAHDADAAVANYRAWAAKKPGTPEPTPDPVADPPPVLGDGATTAATPPLATEYKTYDQVGDALKNFLSREAASSTPPPVVG